MLLAQTEFDGNQDAVWKSFFTQPLEAAQHIVQAQKANGEAAHFGAFYWPHPEALSSKEGGTGIAVGGE